MSKIYKHLGENSKKYGHSTTILSITERKTSIHWDTSLIWATKRDLLRAQADVEIYFRCFYCILFINKVLKSPHDKKLINLICSIITGKSQNSAGVIIRDGDRKRVLILLLGLSPWFSIFRANCAITCGTRAYMLRGFLCMSRGGNDVRNHRNVWYFRPTKAHYSILSCLLEFCSTIFVVGCSSLSEVRQCWI